MVPDFYSGCATGIPGRFSEGLLLRRVHGSWLIWIALQFAYKSDESRKMLAAEQIALCVGLAEGGG
jgi:hypothetical protein